MYADIYKHVFEVLIILNNTKYHVVLFLNWNPGSIHSLCPWLLFPPVHPGSQWRSGRVLASQPGDLWFETKRVSILTAKTVHLDNPLRSPTRRANSIVLVKTAPQKPGQQGMCRPYTRSSWLYNDYKKIVNVQIYVRLLIQNTWKLTWRIPQMRRTCSREDQK